LVDEVSLLVAPVADGRIGTPALFDAAGEGVVPRGLILKQVERRGGDVLWLRYTVARLDDRG
jgi:2,5-diamino-6-(ribosylamino)-4(3H)-pyrimidinone 5'-phosphate reductase